jgi:hypothetical protein
MPAELISINPYRPSAFCAITVAQLNSIKIKTPA